MQATQAPLRMTVAIVSALGVAACARAAPVDIMTLPAVCDSLPHVAPGSYWRMAHPPSISPSPPLGTIVGTVAEMETERPLGSSDVAIRPPSADPAAARSVQTDSVGGFVVRHLAPGRYTIRVRALNHLPRELRVEAHYGTVDTVRVRLRSYTCQGY